jgi:serine phosphatase RsbU (regulator of sigma subunit)
VLVSQARLIRAGSDGPQLLFLFLRDNTRRELARQDALDALNAEQISARQITAFSSALMSAATERELQQVVLTRVAATFGGTGCVVAFTENDRLRVSSDGGTDPRLTQHLDGMPLDAANPLPYAIRTGEAQFIPNREEFVRLWPEAGYLLPLTSDAALSVIPFGSAGGQQIGAWAVSYGSEHHASLNEQTLIGTLAGLAGQALRRIRLQQARIELAMIVQQTMLPTVPTDLPGLEIAARYQPSRDGLDIGGDWYDAFMSPDGTVVLEIGDVQGHDVDAAAFMGQIRASLRAFAFDEPKPDTVLTRTNDLLVTMAAARFVSCTVLCFDPRAGRVSGASAGHVPLMWARTDGSYGTRELPGGPVLGVLEGASYGQEDFDLGMDTALVLVTDGVVEGPGTPLESGLNRAGALAAQALVEGLGTQETADRVLGAGAEVDYRDDMAVLVIRRTEKNDGNNGSSRSPQA